VPGTASGAYSEVKRHDTSGLAQGQLQTAKRAEGVRTDNRHAIQAVIPTNVPQQLHAVDIRHHYILHKESKPQTSTPSLEVERALARPGSNEASLRFHKQARGLLS